MDRTFEVKQKEWKGKKLPNKKKVGEYVTLSIGTMGIKVMDGMMPMMRMMQKMGPMMEACTEMMQQMAHHQSGHPDSAMPPAGQDTTPAPQGG